MADQEFHLDVDALVKDVPLLLRGKAKELLNRINTMDLNKDGKADLAQAAKVYFILVPLGQKLNSAVDFNLLADWLVAQPWVKDQALVKAAIKEACEQIEKMDDKGA